MKGGGAVQTLLIIFLVLKLADVIDWSWWWILSPAWIAGLILLGTFTALALLPKDTQEQ